jgi:MFS family permease
LTFAGAAQPQGGRGDDTPRPRQACLIGLILLSNGFSSMVIFPFLPFMTHRFFPALKPEQLGYKVGLLGSAYFAGSFGGSILWGFLSDRIGRRPCLLCGMAGTVLAVALFSTADTFGRAVTARFLWGLLNGNIGVAKTYMAEICDDSNQARGMALIAAQGGFGRLLGPLVGGFLAEPADRLGAPFAGAEPWVSMPYLLPCLPGLALALLALCGAWAALPETLPATQPLWRVLCGLCGGGGGGGGDRGDDDGDACMGAGGGGCARSLPRPPPCGSAICVSVFMYATIGFYQIVVQEVLPLWALNDAAHGGFSFDPGDIGLVVTCLAPFQILGQLFVFPRLAKRSGYRRLFCVCATVSASFAVALPWTRVAMPAGASRGAAIAAVAVLFTFTMVPIFFAFTSVFVLINNAAPRARRGAVNGLAQSTVALTRMAGPTLGGSVFAWSSSRTGAEDAAWPFNYHLAWVLLGLTGAGAVCLGMKLPESSELKFVEAAGEGEGAHGGASSGAGGAVLLAVAGARRGGGGGDGGGGGGGGGGISSSSSSSSSDCLAVREGGAARNVGASNKGRGAKRTLGQLIAQRPVRSRSRHRYLQVHSSDTTTVIV